MIVRASAETPRRGIPTDILNNSSRLSAEALGVLCFLLGKPDDWEVRVEEIDRTFGFSKEKRRRVLREIQKAGYGAYVLDRAQGRITTTRFVVSESPAIKPETAQPAPTATPPSPPPPAAETTKEEAPSAIVPADKPTFGPADPERKALYEAVVALTKINIRLINQRELFDLNRLLDSLYDQGERAKDVDSFGRWVKKKYPWMRVTPQQIGRTWGEFQQAREKARARKAAVEAKAKSAPQGCDQCRNSGMVGYVLDFKAARMVPCVCNKEAVA